MHRDQPLSTRPIVDAFPKDGFPMKKTTVYGLLLIAAALIALVPGCRSAAPATGCATCGK